MSVLLIDNYDSFTFNLFHLVATVLGRPPIVVTNDAIGPDELAHLAPDAIVISPGPGHPGVARDVGISAAALTDADIPVLGVCLGHQALAHVMGGRVGRAPEPVHGRLSAIFHDGSDLFDAVPQGFDAVRYHSLAVLGDLPDGLEASAWTADGVVMGLRHVSRPLRGVQFHPESICTQHGARLMSNFFRSVAGLAPSLATVVTRRARSVHRRRSVHVRRLAHAPDPEATFAALFADQRHAFWLDSSLVGQHGGRFSYMGDASGPDAEVIEYDGVSRTTTLTARGRTRKTSEPFFELVQRYLARPTQPVDGLPFEFNGGLVGYLGYEMARECGYPSRHRATNPDAALIRADRYIVFDVLAGDAYLVCQSDAVTAQRWFDETEHRVANVPESVEFVGDDGDGPVVFELRRSQREYIADIERCLQEIGAGESYEICLTNQLVTDPIDRPFELYRILRKTSPAPYAAFLRLGDTAVLSSSPELFLHVGPDGVVTSKPIKGTAPRCEDDDDDQRARDALAASEKDRAENLMIVDLLRNDLGRVGALGSVEVPLLMDVESYAVHQLVSTVRARLRSDATAVDLIRSAFPGGSMTGAPKRRTLEILDRLEVGPRGVYSGCIGWLGANGAAQLNIVIRTAVVTPTSTSIGIGGAIVALSNAEAEFDETLLKAGALVRAIVAYRTGSYDRARVELAGAEDPDTRLACFEATRPTPSPERQPG
jgi:para-aminobenzoate synthetase